MAKKFLYKIYQNDGTFIRALPVRQPINPQTNDFNVIGEPRITQSINQGHGELQFEVDKAFDDFDQGVTIKNNNIVKLYIVDENYPTGKLVYTGIISTFTPYIRDSFEGVSVTCLSRLSELSTDYYMSGSSYTVTLSGQPASDNFQNIIDHFRAEYDNSDINYKTVNRTGNVTSVSTAITNLSQTSDLRVGMVVTGTGISTDSIIMSIDSDTQVTMNQNGASDQTGVTFSLSTVKTTSPDVNIDYVQKKWKACIDDTLKISPANYFWRIDEDGYAWLTEKPPTAIHTFKATRNFGHVEELEVPKTMEPVINYVILESSAPSTPHTASNTTSIASFGTRSMYLTDTGINDDTTAIERVTAYIANNKDEKLRVTATINDSYDIESIKPGHTCKIIGERVGSSLLSNNMMIVRVEYDGERARLTLEQDNTNLSEKLREFNGDS